MTERLGVRLVGVRHCAYDCGLALGYLQAYAQSRPGLKRRLSIGIEVFSTSDAVAAAADRVLSSSPGMVGLSCYLWNVRWIAALARRLKSARPELMVVLGGPEVSARPLRYMDACPEADFIVVGEGEATFADLLRALLSGGGSERLERVAGLAWRGGQGVRLNEARPLVDDLGEIPSPFLEGILPLGGYPHLCFESDRGCPFDCKFCDWKNKRRVRTFDEERVLSETRLLLEKLPRAKVFMCDADMFLDRERGRRLIRGFRRAGEGKRCVWELHTYLPNLGMDEELMASLDSEKFTLAVGIQSVNPHVLRGLTRFFDDAKTRANAALLRRLAPRAKLNAQLIYGLPGDDLEGFEASIEYALSLWPDTLMLFPALALPGSGMGDDPERYGLRCQKEPPYRVLSSDSFSARDLRAADMLAFWNFTFQGAGFVARALRYLGASLAGGVPMSYVRSLKGFARSLEGTPLDLSELYRRARKDLLGFVTFDEEPWGHDFLRAHGREFVDRLRAYARRALEESGRADAWPPLDAFLERQRRVLLWKDLTRTVAFHRLVEKLVGGSANGRGPAAEDCWIGCEEFSAAEGASCPARGACTGYLRS
ncbi:MAG: cobalamin-dependent protein [Elusimicrobiota bacterium]